MRAASTPSILTGLMPESIIKLALTTTKRQAELLGLQHNWIDLQSRMISLPADSTKKRTGRTAALFSEAVSVISALPRHINSRLLGAWKDESSLTKPWQRLLKRTKDIYLNDCEEKYIKPDAKMVDAKRLTNLQLEAQRHYTAFLKRSACL